jgi:arsenate reductase-like glutaredoxin family protein
MATAMRMRAACFVVMTGLVGACGASRAQVAPLAPAGAPPSEEAPVIVYGARWCQHTRAALDYFRGRSIPVRFRDVDSDVDAYDEMINRARAANVQARGIPILSVRNRMLVGFHQDEIERALQD